MPLSVSFAGGKGGDEPGLGQLRGFCGCDDALYQSIAVASIFLFFAFVLSLWLAICLLIRVVKSQLPGRALMPNDITLFCHQWCPRDMCIYSPPSKGSAGILHADKWSQTLDSVL
jgi:hypothetical protein